MVAKKPYIPETGLKAWIFSGIPNPTYLIFVYWNNNNGTTATT
jgi:hypothetical protein